MKEEQLYRKAFLLALSSINGIGPKKILNILKVCKSKALSFNEFWANKYHIWQEILLNENIILSIKKFKKEHNLLDNLNEIENSGIQVLSFEDQDFPMLLLETNDFPVILFVKSKVKVGSSAWNRAFSNTISVVGTRKITPYGSLVIKELLPPLISLGKVITSGFMYGVDLEAAKLAVANNEKTIAVLGYGFNHCFPKSQKKVMQEFIEKGAIFLSEFAPEVEARASNFVIRNRIVAALSKATLVIEAASRSGSHITASYANEYGRLVMAVPGPITNPFSEGTKALINQGAVLVNSASDILNEIKEDYHFSELDGSKANKTKAKSESSELNMLLDNLTFYPELAFEDLLKNTNIEAAKLNQLLFNLELQGKIIKKWGKYCLVS